MSKSNNERPFNRIYQPDNISVTKSDTPRVDADEEWAVSGTGEDFRCVHASFARELERELAAKEVELTEANRKLDRYTRRSESGESLGDALDLAEELAESRAQVARLRDSLYALVTYPEAFKSLAEIAKKELVTLPDQSARDAAVLMAAEEVVKHRAKNSYDGSFFWPAVDALCQAVRGDGK